MISIARIFIILATLIFSFSSIHSTYANNVYYLSKNNCESGEEAELVDCLRNEVIEVSRCLFFQTAKNSR